MLALALCASGWLFAGHSTARAQPRVDGVSEPGTGSVKEAVVDDAQVRLVGRAVDAKSGAAVVVPGVPDEPVWLIEGVQAWPAAVTGREVVVEGIRGRRALPEARRGSDGSISQGVAPGTPPALIVQRAHWRLADPAGGPWTLSLANGSGDQTRVTFDGAQATWSYHPVTPLQSSTGFYDGGPPASGTLTPAEARALWTQARTQVLDAPETPAPRGKGTGLLMLSDPTSERVWVVQRGARLEALLALFDRLRRTK